MSGCKNCGSYAINHHLYGRDVSDADLCDVCYWRKRAGDAMAKQWVGLTDEETITQANKELFPGAFARGAIWAQLKLKEKNNG